jgi:hypothetical protein
VGSGCVLLTTWAGVVDGCGGWDLPGAVVDRAGGGGDVAQRQCIVEVVGGGGHRRWW